MQVRLKTIMAGPAGTGQPGDVVDLPTAQAYALIEGGYAAQLGAETPTPAGPETATAAPPERAVPARGKRR